METRPVVLKAQRFNKHWHYRGPTQSRSQTRTFMHTVSGFLIGRPILSLCSSRSSEMGDSGCCVGGLASLQKLSRTFHWETAGWQAGWLLVNKLNNKQQRRLYIIPTEIKKKSIVKRGLTHVILFLWSLTILPQFANKRKGLLSKAWLCYQWRAALLILLRYLG